MSFLLDQLSAYNDNHCDFKGISDSEKAGLEIIYQELALVPQMTVYENIYLGHDIKSGMIITN